MEKIDYVLAILMVAILVLLAFAIPKIIKVENDKHESDVTWFVRPYDYGVITKTAYYPCGCTGEIVEYFFQMDNEVWIQIDWVEYNRWRNGDTFKYFTDEITTELPWVVGE